MAAVAASNSSDFHRIIEKNSLKASFFFLNNESKKDMVSGEAGFLLPMMTIEDALSATSIFAKAVFALARRPLSRCPWEVLPGCLRIASSALDSQE